MSDQPFNFEEYQQAAYSVAVYPEVGTSSSLAVTYGILGLNGEAGEVAEKFKKILRDKGGVVTDEDREELKKELGDVLWYISATAGELGLALEDVALSNINKLVSRRTRGVLAGSGDNR